MKTKTLLLTSLIALYGCQSTANDATTPLIAQSERKVMNFDPALLIGKWQCEQRQTHTQEDGVDFTNKVDLELDYRADNTYVNTFNATIEDTEDETWRYNIVKTGTWEISRSLIKETTADVRANNVNTPEEVFASFQEIVEHLKTTRVRANDLIESLDGKVLKTRLCAICTDRYRGIYNRDNLIAGQDDEHLTCRKK